MHCYVAHSCHFIPLSSVAHQDARWLTVMCWPQLQQQQKQLQQRGRVRLQAPLTSGSLSCMQDPLFSMCAELPAASRTICSLH